MFTILKFAQTFNLLTRYSFIQLDSLRNANPLNLSLPSILVRFSLASPYLFHILPALEKV